MMKTILKFLIALIAPSTLTVIYIFSESHIVKLLSTDSTGELSRTLLRSGLGVSGTIIFALSYWICDLKEKLKSSEATIQSNIVNKPKQVETPLEDVEVKILQILFRAPFAMPQTALLEAVGISHQLTHFHLEELSRRKMVKHKRSMSGATRGLKLWALDHEGRRYLKDHNLTS